MPVYWPPVTLNEWKLYNDQDLRRKFYSMNLDNDVLNATLAT